jgi:mRNA-degrading endonuclease RelE of RelBE toxin-antitoxin system
MGRYSLVYADSRVEREFLKAINKIPADFQEQIMEKLAALQDNPRPAQFKILSQPVFIHGYWAPYRLRTGDYRVLYDIDERMKRVVILSLRRRNEGTYR